jgi:hypothetical protein
MSSPKPLPREIVEPAIDRYFQRQFVAREDFWAHLQKFGLGSRQREVAIE